MATTLSQLTQQVSNLLHGFTGYHEQVTWLTGSVDSSQTTFAVNDPTQVRIGVAEVDDELVYVSSAGTTDVVLAPFGRGYMGSTAVAHDANTIVRANPLFPRADIQQAIRETLEQVYPAIYQIKESTFSFVSTIMSYEVPADVDSILTVEWQLTGPTLYDAPIHEWDLIENSSRFGTGKAITLFEAAEAGQDVQVTYMAKFGTLVDGNTTLESIGFPVSALDVLKYGAAQRLIRGVDISRLQMRSVENASRAAYVEPGDATQVANTWFALFQQRLLEERDRLIKLHPPRPNYTR